MVVSQVTVIFRNKHGSSAWEGCIEDSVIRFDFENPRGKRRFFVLPDKCVMMCDEFGLVPQFDRRWYVHLIDASEIKPGTWLVEDREIDVFVQEDLRTYRVVDMEEFADAVESARISVPDACRLLKALQAFLDDYLHSGGEFPPKEISKV